MPVLILSAKRIGRRPRSRSAGGRRRLSHQAVRLCRTARAGAGAGATRRHAPRSRRRSTVGDLSLDLLTRKVTRADTAIDLRPREFALLEYLMRNGGRVVSKTMILSHVWEYSFDPQTNIVDVLVSRLRDKIDRPFEPKLLRTVRGIGYVLG